MVPRTEDLTPGTRVRFYGRELEVERLFDRSNPSFVEADVAGVILKDPTASFGHREAYVSELELVDPLEAQIQSLLVAIVEGLRSDDPARRDEAEEKARYVLESVVA